MNTGSYFPPVEAIPSMNCFWKMRYRITIGSIASREPAISTGKLVLNWPRRVARPELRVIMFRSE